MSKERLGFMSVTGAVYAVVALLVVLAWWLIGGAALFSAGGLNASVTGLGGSRTTRSSWAGATRATRHRGARRPWPTGAWPATQM